MTSQPSYRPFGAFRFLLAMMVLLQHGLVLLPDGAGRALFYNLELGAVAVAVFFALSGFIVAEAMATFYAGRPGAFLVNRCLRVVPPYGAAVALAVALDSALYAAGHLVTLDAPLRGAPWHGPVVLSGLLEIVPGLRAARISGQDFSFIPFAWTLRVEFAFYLAAALMGWLVMRRWVAAWRGPLTPTAFLAGYAAFAAFLAWHAPQAGTGRQALNVPFFAFGICAFVVRGARSPVMRVHLLLCAACVPVAFVLCGERGHPVLAWQLPLLCGLFAALLVLSRAPAPRGVWLGWDKRLGALSYPLYIGHGVVLTVLLSVWSARGIVPYLAAVGGAVVLAVGLHAVTERPMAGLRARVRGAVV